jgi:hypothetical protein
MLNSGQEKILSSVIAIGTALTTIFVVSGTVTDPVNATKFLTLGVTAVSAFGVLISSGRFQGILESKLLLATLILFLVFSLLSVVFGQSPLTQGIYGVYGRNNGFLTYLFLGILLLTTSRLNSVGSIKKIIKALIFAGIVNIIYCFWAIAFGDFIGWSNPYGNILGTFGNPNFIGSFLGIFLAAYLGYALKESKSNWLRYSLVLVLPLTAYEILNSNAIQGRVVGAVGVGIVGFYYIRSRFSSIYKWIYVGLGITGSSLALFGALQIGPLTSYVYKTSVSLRGQYWKAGWNTGEGHSLFGVGMDSFGDWYRRSRDAHALELPGVNTIVNASHNVPIDMYAFGGLPLFISYIFLMGLGGWALLRLTLRSKNFDPVLAVLASGWVGYQLQSIISINQIGLAIWGWVLTGAAIAYERVTRISKQETKENSTKPRKSSDQGTQELKSVSIGSIFGLVGLLVALPPFTADSKWRSAQLSQTVQSIEATMKPGYFNPQNSTKYLTNIQVLEGSNLFELSRKYALEAVSWNPEAFELWKVLYLIKNSTASEKALALQNMKRLDPLNPDVTSVK